MQAGLRFSEAQKSDLETVKTSVADPLKTLGSGATGLKTDVPDFNL